eukprot:TRINITY_DN7034_c0_g1_i1.p1 TRINITY_DN7034_c0_g1~~TRINITY_DN7034_c0_g1_i1.p1  ORF type:complete len:279 (-),score=42.72 TRINITY_DN7034_c0_g1_i1:618-1454(-)
MSSEHLVAFLLDKHLISPVEAEELSGFKKDPLLARLLERVPELEETEEYARFVQGIDESLLPSRNAAKDVEAWVFVVYRPNLLAKRVRRALLDLVHDKAAPWQVLDRAEASRLPFAFERVLIKYLFATPTVANSDEPYSTTYKRAANFISGETQMLRRKGVRYLRGSNGLLLAAPCHPSMQARKYDPILGVVWPEDIPDGEQEMSMRALKSCFFSFCTCKNGNDGGNCAHCCALARTVAQIQGTEKIKRTLVDKQLGCIAHSDLGRRRRAFEASMAFS